METSLDGLPLNLDDLLHARAVESNRLELKANWDERTRPAVLRTVCAFANDLLNLGGGYVILGVEERDGRPVLPPCGLADRNLDRLQREIRGLCERIQPAYQPLVFPVRSATSMKKEPISASPSPCTRCIAPVPPRCRVSRPPT